jgi:hypothetical protein
MVVKHSQSVKRRENLTVITRDLVQAITLLSKNHPYAYLFL